MAKFPQFSKSLANVKASFKTFFAYRPTVFLCLYVVYAFLGIYFVPFASQHASLLDDVILSANFVFVYLTWPRTVGEYISSGITIFLIISLFVWFYLTISYNYRSHVKAEAKAQAKAEAKAQAVARAKARWDALQKAFDESIDSELEELKKAFKRADATNMKVIPVLGWQFSTYELLAESSTVFPQEQIGFVEDNFLYIQKDVVDCLYAAIPYPNFGAWKSMYAYSIDTNQRVYIVHEDELELSRLYVNLTFDLFYNSEQLRKEAFAAQIFQVYSRSQNDKYVKERINELYQRPLRGVYEQAVPPPPLTEVPPSVGGLLGGLLGAILGGAYMGVGHYGPSCLSHTATQGLFVNTDTNKKDREKEQKEPLD